MVSVQSTMVPLGTAAPAFELPDPDGHPDETPARMAEQARQWRWTFPLQPMLASWPTSICWPAAR